MKKTILTLSSLIAISVITINFNKTNCKSQNKELAKIPMCSHLEEAVKDAKKTLDACQTAACSIKWGKILSSRQTERRSCMSQTYGGGY